MKRLEFQLPDFSRVVWANTSAAECWAPRMKMILNAFSSIEVMSVAEGLRDCAILLLDSEQLSAITPALSARGLTFTALERLEVTRHPYSNDAIPYRGQGPFQIRVAIGKFKNIHAMYEAWSQNDNYVIGRLLGYPDCCTKFFTATWVKNGYLDTTWPMAIGSHSCERHKDVATISGSPEANILWRWVGVRSVPHLPCAFDCVETERLGRTFWEIDPSFALEREWLIEILSWPVEWSSLHGIACIKTPILKVVSRTDATSTKYIVRRLGSTYPAEGVRGLGFPYDQHFGG